MFEPKSSWFTYYESHEHALQDQKQKGRTRVTQSAATHKSQARERLEQTMGGKKGADATERFEFRFNSAEGRV